VRSCNEAGAAKQGQAGPVIGRGRARETSAIPHQCASCDWPPCDRRLPARCRSARGVGRPRLPERAGLRGANAETGATGDIITAAGRIPIRNPFDLACSHHHADRSARR